MADIFISYARSDRARAQALARALEQQGYFVWWDPKIPPGKTFDQVIEEALDSARCVVVLWSTESVESDWVKEEAAEGKRRNILIPVLIDDVTIPLGFKRIQAANLTDWQADTTHSGFTNLLQAVSEIAGPPPAKKLERKAKKERRRKEHPEPPNRRHILVIARLIGVALILLVGVLWYTQRQEAPSRPARQVGRDGMFIAYANGVVLDSKTGLEWVADPSERDWDKAKSWVQGLNIDGGGWRMPTLEELETLYKKGGGTHNMTPLLKTTGWFNKGRGLTGWFVWSGKTKDSSSAWRFNFNDGSKGWDARVYGFDNHAFAVRSRR
jgi:hypothetical protein